MNKFGKATEEDFETVADVIKKMIEKSSKLLADRRKRKNSDPKISADI